MASIPLTLAALATSAVPGLVVHGAREHVGDGDGAFTSAVLVADERELIVRVPRTQAAEVQQSAELLGLAALTEGARSRLPFEVPETLGITRAGDTRATVTTFLSGGRVSASDIESGALLLQPIAEAVAAIHELPHSLVQQGGLSTLSAEDVRLQAARLVERAEATRLLPEIVHERWTQALSAAEMWDFAPAVVHGSLDADHLLIADEGIAGVLGWGELSVGDPAGDLAWLISSGEEVFDTVLARYSLLRDAGHLGRLRARAMFTHQLGVARWLLHGVESRDSEVVDDAVAMLDRLMDRLTSMGEPLPTRRPLSDDQVSQLLDEIPEVNDLLSDTAAYEALDEDRMFHTDTDFVEVLHGEAAGDREGDDRDEGDGEQLTEPLDPLEHVDPVEHVDSVEHRTQSDDEAQRGPTRGGDTERS